VLARELPVRLAGVGRDAEDHGVLLPDLLPEIAEAARLLRAPGGVVLRVEVEDHVLAREIFERHPLAVAAFERERRRGLPFLDACHARSSYSVALEPRQAVAVIRRVAERDLRRPGRLQIEADLVLVGHADAT